MRRPEATRLTASGDEHVLRVPSGGEVKDAILRHARERGLEGAHVEAIGALRGARLRYWNAATKEYEDHTLDEQLEVLSLSGNLARSGDDLKLHLHAVLGRSDLSVIGGHVRSAVVHPTLEVFLRPIPSGLRRTKDAETGLDLLDLRDDAGGPKNGVGR